MQTKGFTLLEMVISIALVALLSLIVFSSFNALNNKQALDRQVDFIESSVVKTRNDALNSKNNVDQKITFSTTSVTFDGVKTEFTGGISLASYSTGTSTITFYRISGTPSATGTLVYQLKQGTTVIATSSILINNLGIIE